MAVVPGEVGTTFDQALSGAIQVFDLGRPLFNGASQSSYHPEFRMELQRRHGDMIREDGSSSSNELVVTGGHVGTHIDALCHVSVDGQLYGGVDAVAAATGEGFSSLGAETIAPMVCRGLLLDVPAIRGVDMCPAAYEISPEDLDDAVHLTGTTPRPGDVLLIRTGWGDTSTTARPTAAFVLAYPDLASPGPPLAKRSSSPGSRCGHAGLRVPRAGYRPTSPPSPPTPPF